MISKNKLLSMLDSYNFEYTLYQHEALFTVEDSVDKRGDIDGAHSKNLFLKNKKDKFFLFSCLETTKIELKLLSKNLELGNISFAKPKYLMEYLGVKPGSVTPFGLLNDINMNVEFFIDKAFLSQKAVNFHPLINTSTISMKPLDFINFLIENKKKVNIFDFNSYNIMN